MKSLFNWRVLLNIVIALALFIGLSAITFRWLDIYTNHGQEVTVPNVMNQSMQEAIKALDDIGLEYEVDSAKYDPKYKPFQVLGIFPKPGSQVKNGRTIVLRINPKTWAKVTLPDILNKYKGLAFRRLEQVGLAVGDTIYEPNIQRDAVIRLLYNGNEVKPGIQLPRFSSIDVVIGTGPKRNISIPNVIGLTLQEARQIINQNLFEIGVIEYDGGENDPNAIVYYQDPSAGTIRDQGMQIDLWVSNKPLSSLQSKIDHLNSIYRIKIDTPPAPLSYDEIPAFDEPVWEEVKEEPKPKKPETKPEPQNINKETPKPQKEQKPTSSNSPTEKKAEEKPKEKPKAKITME